MALQASVAISSLIFAIAMAGLRPFGQVLVHCDGRNGHHGRSECEGAKDVRCKMVWHRYNDSEFCILAFLCQVSAQPPHGSLERVVHWAVYSRKPTASERYPSWRVMAADDSTALRLAPGFAGQLVRRVVERGRRKCCTSTHE
jgi:hypothetical protein